jgi:hypothetical protein
MLRKRCMLGGGLGIQLFPPFGYLVCCKAVQDLPIFFFFGPLQVRSGRSSLHTASTSQACWRGLSRWHGMRVPLWLWTWHPLRWGCGRAVRWGKLAYGMCCGRCAGVGGVGFCSVSWFSSHV